MKFKSKKEKMEKQRIALQLRIPALLHKEVKKIVKETYGSQNQFIVEAIAIVVKQYKLDKENL